MFRLRRFLISFLGLAAALGGVDVRADETIRIMAANLTSGNAQSYNEGHGNRIFQGLDPDIALVQEMNVGTGSAKNTASTYRSWVDATFGSSFTYFVEPSGNIPNGIVSRYPILEAGEWDDTTMTDRDYVWARIDIPGAKDLWAVSVHISSGGGASQRNTEAKEIRDYVLARVPDADFLVIGGDMNTDNRSEACVSTFSSVVVTSGPYPADQSGTQGTNASRAKPYDWVMPDADLNACKTTLVIGSKSFPNGLVFDSRVYSPLSEVAPVLSGDSGATNMQHMAVMRAFLIPVNAPPVVTVAADSASNETDSGFEIVRGTSVGLSITATDDGGAGTLKFTWAVTSGAPVSFSANGTNASRTPVATFPAAGDRTLTVTVADAAGLTATSSVKLRVVQTATGLVVTPGSVSLPVNASQGFTAALSDQFGAAMSAAVSWSASGGGSIDGDGIFSAATAGGPFSVTATSAGKSASANVTVIAPDPWEQWKNTHFTPAEKTAGLADDPADPDADGLANLAEYALGTGPRAFTAAPVPVLANGFLTLNFTRPAGLPAIRYEAESSPDLAIWTGVAVELIESGPVETLRVRIVAPTRQPLFVRLRFVRE